MTDEPFSSGDSFIHILDPRCRFITALAASTVIALADGGKAVAASLALGTCLTGLAHLNSYYLVRRMLAVNIFVLLIAITLPPGIPGRQVFSIGPAVYSAEGLMAAGIIALKTNSLVLVYTSLVSTINSAELAQTFAHFRLPGKLILLYIMTIRYIHLLHDETSRLRRAMKTRCFAPGTNLHTFRVYGQMIATMLLRAIHRSERIVDTMRCRCWREGYRTSYNFTFSARDLIFAIASTIILLIITAEHTYGQYLI